MAEWLIAPVLKTGVPQGTGGSNPSLSVRNKINRDSKDDLSAGLSPKKAKAAGFEGGAVETGEKESLSLRKAC